jgi:RHS repeat-associated protein
MTLLARWGILLALWLLAGVAQAGTHHHYYTDPQGTVLAKTDAQGNVIATYDYAPYGQAVAGMSGAPDGPGYTAHVNDPETGLVYMQARYYDPAIGRFLSADPVGVSPRDVFGFNRYDYAKNNPILNNDPSGMCADHYENGKCKVIIDPSTPKNESPNKAQKRLEKVLNSYDKAVNDLTDDKIYRYEGITVSGKLTGKEIKTLWNSTHFKIVPNNTPFNNGGGGGGTANGLSKLTSGVVNGYASYSPISGVSTLVFHELGHETSAGGAAIMGNETKISGPAYDLRERQVQTIGKSMAGSVDAPFDCHASQEGCD